MLFKFQGVATSDATSTLGTLDSTSRIQESHSAKEAREYNRCEVVYVRFLGEVKRISTTCRTDGYRATDRITNHRMPDEEEYLEFGFALSTLHCQLCISGASPSEALSSMVSQ